MTSFFREQLERWLKSIDVECDFCLDIGGGQKPVKDRVKSWKVKKYKVLDNDAQFKPDYFADLNHVFDKNPWQLLGIPFNKVDVIFCLEVMEYIWRPLQAHKNILHLLRPGGIAYISYPTIYPLHNPPGIDYLRYTKNAIEKILSELRFRTWEITPRMASEGLESLSNFYSYEKMRPIKGTKEIFDIGYLVKCYAPDG